MSGSQFGEDDRRRSRRWPGYNAPSRDDVIAMALVEQLLDDPDVHSGMLDVSVQNGVAILDGTVPTEQVRCAVLRRARATPGVRDVCDALMVNAGP